MRLKTPSFWYDTSHSGAKLKATALSPLAGIYSIGHYLHQKSAKAYTPSVPVLCIGNLVAGGGGKTPTALALMSFLKQKQNKDFINPVFLSRGYGGSLSGPVTVDKNKHRADQVGDEPLMLAQLATTIIAKDRKAGAIYAEETGADLIIMDDGLQNASLTKTVKIIVIDGSYGFGNGRLLPAGPLRQPLTTGLDAADAFILIGKDKSCIRQQLPDNRPLFQATIDVAEEWQCDTDKPYIAFAGIAHPQKLYDTLRQQKLNIVGCHSFPDHHSYSRTELTELVSNAKAKDAGLITTEKDAIRLPSSFKQDNHIDILPITINISNMDELESLLKNKINKRQ